MLTLWAVVAISSVARLTIDAARSGRQEGEQSALVVALVAWSIVLCALSLPWLVRLGSGPDLVWNWDWTFAWSHARAIASSGSVASSLDYAGAPIVYHVGPVWMAGAVEWWVGGGSDVVLFGVIPILSAMTACVCGARFLAGPDVHRWHVGLLAACVPVLIPDGGWALPDTVPLLLRDLASLSGEQYHFSTLVTLGGIYALAVGLAALQLLIGRGSLAAKVMGALALASVVVIKPQYFAGFGLVFGLFGVLQAVRGGAVSHRLASLGLASLALSTAVILLAVVPSLGETVASFRLEAGFLDTLVGALRAEIQRPHVLIGLAAASWGWTLRRRTGPEKRDAWQDAPALLGICSGIALIVLWTILVAVDVELDPVVAARAPLIGLSEANLRAEFNFNLVQSLIPVRYLLVLAAATFVLGRLRFRQVGARSILLGLIALTAVRGLHVTASWLWPDAAPRAYRVTPGLEETLKFAPRDATIVTTDMASPAENYGEPLLASYLPAIGARRFYVASVRFGGVVYEDLNERLLASRRFVGSPWSAWHEWWLGEIGATHVLVHGRCPPVWIGEEPLDRVASSGGWILLSVNRAAMRPSFAPPREPSFTDITPRFGRAACLQGVRVRR